MKKPQLIALVFFSIITNAIFGYSLKVKIDHNAPIINHAWIDNNNSATLCKTGIHIVNNDSQQGDINNNAAYELSDHINCADCFKSVVTLNIRGHGQRNINFNTSGCGNVDVYSGPDYVSVTSHGPAGDVENIVTFKYK